MAIREYVIEMLDTLQRDSDDLHKLERYSRGEMANPYMPDGANAEYKLLAQRCMTPWTQVIVNTPVQTSAVDDIRTGDPADVEEDADLNNPLWDHWQESRLDARQHSIYRAACTYGFAFTLTGFHRGKLITRGMSSLNTTAIFEDPANDLDPIAGLTVTTWPSASDDGTGEALAWDEYNQYTITWEDWTDPSISEGEPHGGNGLCPLTRFPCYLDLEGRPIGLIEPLIPLQDRINQTVFDLLVVQTHGSFEVRTVTGMAPPTKKVWDQDTGNWVTATDSEGKPIPDKVYLNASRFMFAANKEVNFGSLPPTPLDGYIDAIESAQRQLAALSQTPPHHILGEIVNISAEALEAAETALSRKVYELHCQWGECWERVMTVYARMKGLTALADDTQIETVWRDFENKQLAQAADGLGKLSQQLGIPPQGLWTRVPGATRKEVQGWIRLADEQDSESQFMTEMRSALVRKGAVNGTAGNASTAPRVSDSG